MAKPENDRGFRVRALGEVAIRCADLPTMRRFYRDVIGLPILDDRDGIVFFDLGPGHAGHRTALALFAHDAGRADLHAQEGPPVSGGRSSLHHVALTVGASEQEAVKTWLAANGVAFRVEAFEWIGWRGVFVSDPEGNTVEFVAKVREGTDERFAAS